MNPLAGELMSLDCKGIYGCHLAAHQLYPTLTPYVLGGPGVPVSPMGPPAAMNV